MGRLLYLRDVVTLRLDRDRCAGCGTCVEVCPHGVLELSDPGVPITAHHATTSGGSDLGYSFNFAVQSEKDFRKQSSLI